MASMKSLLKSLRYISQMFDEGKEREMQIGLPTDVKHVAHIGSDGPSSDSAPTWMNEYKPPGVATESGGPGGDDKNQEAKFNPEGSNDTGSAGLKQLLPTNETEKPKNRTRRKPATAESFLESTTEKTGSLTSTGPKTSRRQHSPQASIDSSNRRKHRKKSEADGINLNNQDAVAPPPKSQSRQRKSRNSVGGESSVRRSRNTVGGESSVRRSSAGEDGSSLRV